MNTINCANEAHGHNFAIYNADSVELLPQLPANSVGMVLYSPPFSNVYTYSDSIRDMGNCDDDAEFIAQYRCMLDGLYRVLLPGRLAVVHCKDLVYYRGQRGTAGLRDFPGDLIRAHQDAGFDLHSRVTIWKDPVVEMQRTKAHGLLYKQLRTDSTMSRQGLAEYLLIFRKWAKSEAEEALVQPVAHTPEDIPLGVWQQWASPVWMDINQTNVLNVKQSREDADEKHMCPLQLDIIERAVRMWSNPGDVVLSPFAGVGSEGVGALTFGRKFVGIELKESYFQTAVRNLSEVDRPQQAGLFETTRVAVDAPRRA